MEPSLSKLNPGDMENIKQADKPDIKDAEDDEVADAVVTARTSLASDIVSTAPGSPQDRRSPIVSTKPNKPVQDEIDDEKYEDPMDGGWEVVEKLEQTAAAGDITRERRGSQGPDTVNEDAAEVKIETVIEKQMIIPRFEDLKTTEGGNMDDYGFFHTTTEPFTGTAIDLQKHRQRESQWVDILQEWPLLSQSPEQAAQYKTVNFDKLKELCRKGIPVSLRGRVWSRMVNVDKYRKDGIYEQLVSTTVPSLDIHDIIERDINRCYPDHFLFRDKSALGQRHLFDLLKAYARYNPAVGYCQGMGRLVGLMLMQMPVEESFWLLVATLEGPLSGYFTPNLDRFRIHAIVFERLLADKMPRLHRHMTRNDVDPLIYTTNWFLTMFTMVLPWQTVLRVWDMFYCEGTKVMFRVALAIMKRCESTLLKRCPSSTEIMQFITRIPHDLLQESDLVKEVLRIRLSRRQVDELERKATDLWTNASPADRASLTLLKRSGRR